MRTSLLCSVAAAAFLSMGMDECCGVGGPELVAMSADGTCWFGDCGLAIGTEVVAELYGDATLVGASLDRPELGDLQLDGDRVVLYPKATGSGILSLQLSDGTVLDSWFTAAAIASTVVVPDRSIQGLSQTYPPGRKLMFAGSTLRLTAEHRDAAGARLLGHGREQWSVTGGTLVEPSPLYSLDTALARDVVAGTGPLLSVQASATGTPYELEVVPAGSTKVLELEYKLGAKRYGELSLGADEFVSAPLNAYAADGRFIAGLPPGVVPVVTVGDTSVVHVYADGRQLRFYGQGAGRTQLTIELDGARAQFDVVIY
jgi:hypothetical protein